MMHISYDDERTLDRLRYKKMSKLLMEELSLPSTPVTLKFFYTQEEFEYFKQRNDFDVPTKPTTFCQWERSACKQEQTIYSEAKDLTCRRAACCFNWEECDDISSSTNQYLNKGIIGMAVAPLDKARFIGDTVNITCNASQAEILIDAWKKASGAQPWRPSTDKDSSSCSSSVFVYNQNIATVGPTCSHPASKNESKEISVILPIDHLRHVVDELVSGKLSLKGSSFNRPGDGFFKIAYW